MQSHDQPQLPTLKVTEISHSMRTNYNTLGVDAFYTRVAQTYRNPHFLGIVHACVCGMDQWLLRRDANDEFKECRVLDLACGSGEATVAIEQWMQARRSTPRKSSDMLLDRVLKRPKEHLKLCMSDHVQLNLIGCDPYTQEAYKLRTGRDALSWSFQDIAQGVAGIEDLPTFDICICSFAAHLIEPSMMYAVMTQSAMHCRFLLIVSPHKKPAIDAAMGWNLIHESMAEMRTHVRLYESLLLSE